MAGETVATILIGPSEIVISSKRRAIWCRSKIASVDTISVKETGTSGDINIAVEEHLATAPIEAPSSPTPPVSAEESKPNPGTEVKCRSHPGIENVSGVNSQRRSVDGPRIVNRQI